MASVHKSSHHVPGVEKDGQKKEDQRLESSK